MRRNNKSGVQLAGELIQQLTQIRLVRRRLKSGSFESITGDFISDLGWFADGDHLGRLRLLQYVPVVGLSHTARTDKTNTGRVGHIDKFLDVREQNAALLQNIADNAA